MSVLWSGRCFLQEYIFNIGESQIGTPIQIFLYRVSLAVVKAPRTYAAARRRLPAHRADEMAESVSNDWGRAIEISLHLDAQKISETAALGASQCTFEVGGRTFSVAIESHFSVYLLLDAPDHRLVLWLRARRVCSGSGVVTQAMNQVTHSSKLQNLDLTS